MRQHGELISLAVVLVLTGLCYEWVAVDSYISSADESLIADYYCEAVPYRGVIS